MATPLYTKLVSVVSTFIGPEKAAGAVGRQLKRCSATEDTFDVEHLREIITFITGATTLYVADQAEKLALEEKVKALAG